MVYFRFINCIYLDKGVVSIRATSGVDADVYDELDITVRKGVFNSNKSSSKWDFENQDADNAYIELANNTADDSQGLNTAFFANVESTKFYAEATFQIKGLTTNAWDWHGIGIGICTGIVIGIGCHW